MITINEPDDVFGIAVVSLLRPFFEEEKFQKKLKNWKKTIVVDLIDLYTFSLTFNDGDITVDYGGKDKYNLKLIIGFDTFMDIEEIGKLCGIGSIGMVKDALKELKKDYDKKENSLEIVEENKKFKLAIRKQYVYITSKLLNDTEFNRPVQETLAIIAFKQPMLQADVVKIRGNNAYDHVKTLREILSSFNPIHMCQIGAVMIPPAIAIIGRTAIATPRTSLTPKAQ